MQYYSHILNTVLEILLLKKNVACGDRHFANFPIMRERHTVW